MTDGIERLCRGNHDLKAEERAGTRWRHHRNRNEPGMGDVENGLIVPFAGQKVSRIKRRQPRDRFLEYDEREAA